MADFDKAIGFIYDNEGGYVNDPNDTGGPTNFGISLRYLKAFGQYGDFDGDGDVDVDDIKIMNKEDSEKIYKRFWWDKLKYGLIKNQEIATKIFDFSINMGASRAHKIAQDAVNDLSDWLKSQGEEELEVDGIFGEKTIRLLNKANPDDVMKSIVRNAEHFYRNLAARNQEFKKYIDGWLKRARRRYN